jgi:hypothetical protein
MENIGGMYGAREEMDEYFLRDNFGVNPDAVDLIKTGWGGEEKTMAEAGSDTAFQALLDLILDNDMTDPDVYAQVVEEIDVINWVDLYCNRSIYRPGRMVVYSRK